MQGRHQAYFLDELVVAELKPTKEKSVYHSVLVFPFQCGEREMEDYCIYTNETNNERERGEKDTWLFVLDIRVLIAFDGVVVVVVMVVIRQFIC